MKYVTLKTCDTAIEAHILRNRLESDDILCHILDEHIVTLNPLLNFAVGGIRLQVFEKDLTKARSILNEIDNKPFTDSQDQIIVCPNCTSSRLYSDFKSIKNPKGIIAIIVAFLFSVFPIYSKSVYKCKECDTEFDLK
jgi:DNA-directed RNA polymerase subunit RPC12/RpoP